MHGSKTPVPKGFTLIELVIVVALVAVIALTVIIVTNPVEVFREARDSQRIADLNQMSRAVSLYVGTASNPFLGVCGDPNGNGPNNAAFQAKCYMQPLNLGANPAPARCGPRTNGGGSSWPTSTMGTSTLIDGGGWVPVNLNEAGYGAPLQAWPVDPKPSVSTPFVRDTSYYYSYYCDTNGQWEFDANLESAKYASSGISDAESTDGGSRSDTYEVGTNTQL